MPTSWEAYLESIASDSLMEDLRPDEPRDPREWEQRDPLPPVAEPQVFGDTIGWTYLAWRQLTAFHRDQVRFERALAAFVRDSLNDFRSHTGFVSAISVGSARTPPNGPAYHEPLPTVQLASLAAFLYCEIPFPTVIHQISINDIFEKAGFEVEENVLHSRSVPVIATPSVHTVALRSVTSPTASSGKLSPAALLQSGNLAYGQTAAGIVTPGTIAMFVERKGRTDPCLIGAHHVLGRVGNTVLDGAQQSIGQVCLEDARIDCSVADLTLPWSIDYRLPRLNVIPGPPLMAYVGMPVQMFGAKSGHQAGQVSQTNFTAPPRPGLPVLNNIHTTIAAQPGDSGALLCSGYNTQPALPPPYLGFVPPQLQAYYTCAAIGVLQGQAYQGVGPIQGSPSVFSYMHDVLATLGLDPLTR